MTGVSRADRDQVEDVLVRYATGIDARHWELFSTCFSEDCEADYGDIGRWRGAAEITAWMAQTHDPLGPTMHRITNIALAYDGDRVRSRCYVHAVVTTADRGAAIHAYGCYDDELVATAEGWRIAVRRFTAVTTEMHQPML